MDGVIAEAIGIALFLLLASGSSAAREALIALENEERFQGAGKGSPSDGLVTWWRGRQKHVLMSVRLGHRLGVVGAVALSMQVALRSYGEILTVHLVGMALGFALFAVLMCDVIPIVVARSNPRGVARVSIQALRVPYFLFFPVTKLMLLVRQLLLRLVGEDGTFGRQSKMVAALEAIVSGGRPAAEERQLLLETVAGSEELIVREVMVPRTDMVTISRDMEFDEILRTLITCGHSRIPVYGESHDEILGFFYAKDLISMMASGRAFDIDNFLRKPYFVPETRLISELLKDFQQRRTHMAVVVDEFGGTAGLITLEDIMEEYFGDIQDEYDVEPSQLVEVSGNRVLADARIGIDEIEEYFDVEMPDEPDYDSLGGFLLSCKGSVPRPGEEIRFKHLLFRVVTANAKRIDSVEIEILPRESEAA